MVRRDDESQPRPFWRYAPGTRGGLLIAVLGIAALAVVGQIIAERVPGGGSDQAQSFGAAVIGVLVVAYGARLVPLGATYLRQDVGARFAAVVYVVAVAVALVAVLLREVWLTGACVAVLLFLTGIVMARRSPEHSGRP